MIAWRISTGLTFLVDAMAGLRLSSLWGKDSPSRHHDPKSFIFLEFLPRPGGLALKSPTPFQSSESPACLSLKVR